MFNRSGIVENERHEGMAASAILLDGGASRETAKGSEPRLFDYQISSSEVSSLRLSSTNNDPLAASTAACSLVARVGIRLGRARTALRGFRIATSASAAVYLDAIALARDAVALTAADGRRVADRGQRRWRRAVGAGRQRGSRGAGRAAGGGRQRRRVRQPGMREAVGQLIDRGEGLSLAQSAGGVGLGGLRMLDLGRRQRATLDDVCGLPTHMAESIGRRGCTAGYVQDVELAAGRGLDGVVDGRIMRDVISVHDVVIPIPTSQLEHRALEAKFPGPCSGLRRILGQR